MDRDSHVSDCQSTVNCRECLHAAVIQRVLDCDDLPRPCFRRLEHVLPAELVVKTLSPICVAPSKRYLQSKVIWLLAPPIFVVFFFGVSMKRLNAKGCLAALIVGFILGVFRLAVDTPVSLKLSGFERVRD